MKIIDKMFGTYSERQIKKVRPIVDRIESLAPKYSAMSDAEMLAETSRFKSMLADGKTLETLPLDVYGEYCDLIDAGVYDAVDMDACVRRRQSSGGTVDEYLCHFASFPLTYFICRATDSGDVPP